MKRYDAMHDNDYVSTDRRESPTGQYVLASDVADLERRYREAVELLRDLWIVLDERAKTDAPSGVYLHLKAFLAGEGKA